MQLVFESILPIFLVIILGFGLRKLSVIPAEKWKTIEDLCFWILFPAIMVKTLLVADFAAIKPGAFTFAIAMFLLAMGLLALSIWPLMKKSINMQPAQYSTVYQTITRWNGFVALVIALNLYGDESLALMAIALAMMTTFIQISNILVLAAFTPGQRPGPLQIIRSVTLNPIVMSIIIGMLIKLSGINVWAPVVASLELVGQAALGISLLTVGAGLSFRAALHSSKELLIALFGKLLLSPLVMLGAAIWLDISGLQLSILLLCASVPTSMNGYFITKKMGGDASLYAATSTVQTACSFLTIPLVLWVAQRYFGAL